MTPGFMREFVRAHLAFAVAALVVICAAASRAKAEGFLDGIRSIDVTMTRVETCIASHYGVGDGYGWRKTASGERMNPHAMIAAHRTRPFGSWVTVTVLSTGRSLRVRIVDRGPFVRGRCIDLSYFAARTLGIGGTARVTVE